MSLPLFIVLGAGRSSGWLIVQLFQYVQAGEIRLLVLDGQPQPLSLDQGVDFQQLAITEETDFAVFLQDAFCCISLLPPFLHPKVMESCLASNTHFISASYESPAARSHALEAQEKKLLILNECGLDPGLDHVTAMAMLKRVGEWGGKVVSFESDCGGLPSRRSLNDWGYRFFWNPMNVVTAGQAGARFHDAGLTHLLSYPEVFRHYRSLYEDDGRALVAYPNRDSLPYQRQYGLEHASTYIRGTIRYQTFCDRWHALAEANVANGAILLEAGTTYGQWVSLFSWHKAAFQLLSDLLQDAGWENEQSSTSTTSAEILLRLLTRCWNPDVGYTDRVIMRHRIVYEKGGQHFAYTGTLDMEGDATHSAMAFTVGLPIAIMARELLKAPLYGVRTPMASDIWPSIYNNLSLHNIRMTYQNLPLP